METDGKESVLQEAHRLINGSRQARYNHPLHDFTKTGLHWTGVLFDKLRPGEEVDALDVALMMTGLKVSREVFTHTRDNLSDGAGYFGTAELIVQLLLEMDILEKKTGEPMHPRFRALFERMKLGGD